MPKLNDNLIIQSALKVYAERLRGMEDQSPITEGTLFRVQELRKKQITSNQTAVTISL